MRLSILAVAGLAVLAGCSQYHYPYVPNPQPKFLQPIGADYKTAEKTVTILVDTHGHDMREIHITKADGSPVKPLSMNVPPSQPQLIGGMSGTADPRYSSSIVGGPITATFDKAAVGPAPWLVYVDIPGVGVTTITVGGAAHK
jgi:hypothetical protein